MVKKGLKEDKNDVFGMLSTVNGIYKSNREV